MVDVNTLKLSKQFTRRLIRPDSWVINCYDPNLAAPIRTCYWVVSGLC